MIKVADDCIRSSATKNDGVPYEKRYQNIKAGAKHSFANLPPQSAQAETLLYDKIAEIRKNVQ